MVGETCVYCGGTLHPQFVAHMQEYQDKWVMVENLPALVCPDCGKRYFTPEVHDRVIALLQHGAPVRTETIAVYDATQEIQQP